MGYHAGTPVGTRGCHQLGASQKPHGTLTSVNPRQGKREVCPLAVSPIPTVKGTFTLLGLCVSQMAEKFRAERTAQGQPTLATPRSWLLQKGLLGKSELRPWEAGRERNLIQGYPCAHKLHLQSPRT